MIQPTILTSNSTVDGCRFVGNFNFQAGIIAPLYEVEQMAAFNQLIGHAKFINAQYGNVYCRGVKGLYDNVLPSLMRGRCNGQADGLNDLLNQICDHPYFCKTLKLRKIPYRRGKDKYFIRNEVIRKNKYCIEALLQHYAGSTRFIDVVDNHWVALWMGLQDFKMTGKGGRFCKCEKRELSVGDIYQELLENDSFDHFIKETLKNDIFEYILLIAMPYADQNPQYGITETAEFVEVDLRKALPSIYLRPHAQHALVVRKRDSNNVENTANYYDMASQVIAILRVRIDRASLWLGDGNLLTVSNLFPSPSIDQGYNNLMMHSDIFKHPFEIIKYY